MIQPTLSEIPRNNQDVRIRTAYNIYEGFNEGQILLHKTTRAGCTTALVAESLNRHEKFLCVVPTNKIADDTVVTDSKKYSDVDKAHIIHIPSNHHCVKNMELCEMYPDLKALPILPLPESCEGCSEYENCEVSHVLRCPECHGTVVTYKKLAAMMLASSSRPNTQAEKILEIISAAKNVIIDEVHDLQFVESTQLTVYNDLIGNTLNIGKYLILPEQLKYLNRVIKQFAIITQNKGVKAAIHNVLGGAEAEDYWKNHLSISINNPSPGIIDGEDPGKVMTAVYNEIIELMKNRKSFNFEIHDVLDLYDMLSIVTNKTIAVSAIRDKGRINVQLSAVDFLFSQMLKSYTMSIQNEEKRIMLTSATIGSYDYKNLFYEDELKRVTFGAGGDPMNTNSKMLILADTKKYGSIGRNSYFKKKEEILSKTIKILELWGDDNCCIITLNRGYAAIMEKDLEAMGHKHGVTYYKAPEMMGVTSKARIMIAIGIAYKPSNSFDVVTSNTQESKVLLEESVHADTWQAWSRVKDPQSKAESVVFGLGCTVEDCKNITTWGYNRTVEIEPYVERQKKKINVRCGRENITKPKVKKCKNFEEMLSEAALHTHNKNIFTEINTNTLFNNKIGRLSQKSVKINSKRDLLHMIINRNDVFAEQSLTGTYFKNEYPLNESLINSHLEGKSTFGAYQLNQASEVKWICFDIDSHSPKNGIETDEEKEKRDQQAETDKDRMCSFLELNGIPYLLEASGSPHSYHVWIFVNPVKARIAKAFGKEIMKAVDIDCELFPKQCTINKNGYGNLVKLPFATNKKHGGKSSICINGEFVRDFESIEIGIINVPEITQEPTEKPVEPKIKVSNGNVRECIKNAVGMSLRGTQGHAMRIAICREYYNAGMHDPDELAKLFINQVDYDFEISRTQVLSIISQQLGNFRCSTLQDKCSKFIDCSKCKNRAI